MRDVLKLTMAGPRQLGSLTESVGSVNGAAVANDAVLNHSLSDCFTPLGSPQLATRLARPLVDIKLMSPVWSGAVIMIGVPRCNTEMPLSSQSPNMVLAIPCFRNARSFPNGRS